MWVAQIRWIGYGLDSSGSKTMHVILTHENADFDAIASLLAAAKLDPDATPVLPRRVNRNVRHFVTLYWDALPFVWPDELPRRRRINQVTLVDTQGLASLRGMTKKPKVQVIDHHPPGEDLDPDWSFQGDIIGATTTLLVERFPESGVQLSPIEATLLLLGIYEDTGSLTYNATTARDVRCAAWLLEQRADLGLLLRFLHHPLSESQRSLYDRLQEAADTYQFDGQSVVVATASAPDYVDEISTLAHKMRDLYDPAALFLLVELEQHIQMVARSTTDTIDVGAVAAHFGGGGHDRAAAAIVKEKSLSEARDELLRVLPDFVLPLTTVEQIMSHGVETLPPDATINDAYERVVRYGYEGYPVVDEGRIIGLLTRRDIDRALQHKLGNAVVSRFMSAGEVSISPQESISALQSLMMEHGWGQIPVVSPEDGRIMGVVTRTDVIKLWQPRPVHSERDQVRAMLERSLPAPLLELVRETSRRAHEMGLRLYFVGGLVRDILLSIPNMDIDMVVEGDAIALARSLANAFGGRVRTHARFGTAKWLLEEGFWARYVSVLEDQPELPRTIDFVTARTEFYERPTVLPQVTQGSIKLDLHRRDFTINTLAIRLDPGRFGELLDFYGGKRDLDSQVIRVLHSLSFIDDPTRILRAVRFEQRLGFRIEARTEELMLQSLTLLDRITGDRIRHELELLLREPQPERGFARLAELGVLAQIHPGLTFDVWVEDCFVRLRDVLQDPIWELAVDDYTIELTHFGLLTFRMNLDGLEMLERRLHVQRTTIDHIRQLHSLKGEFGRLARAQTPSAVFQILEPYSRQVLLMVFVAADDPVIRDLVYRFVQSWAGVRTVTTGRELQELGLKPGPIFSKLLDELLFARLDGRVSTDEEERIYLQHLLEN
jgi:tRNA nucleotidyltransferase (CCA-adding enzyme)